MRRYPNTNTFTGYTAEELAENFENAYVKDDVVYWKSNDRSPFEDMLTDFMEAGFITQENVDLTIAAKEMQDMEAIMDYINFREENGYSDEEKYEIRAALGDEANDAVNIFTGKRIFA